MGKTVVVVGAGLGGLVCARRLLRNGHQVLVFEKDDRVGGRLKTDTVDGFTIDRGFQTFFTAYPYLAREVDYKKLGLKTFVPGCRVVWNGQLRDIRNDRPLKMVFSRFLDFTDKFRIKGYSAMLATLSPQQIWLVDDRSAYDELVQNGLEGAVIEKFARPFFGGVFLDRSLGMSHKVMRYVWKMLGEGLAALPAKGMEAIPRQIAESLPEGVVKCDTGVSRVLKEGGKTVGVELASGAEIRADAVVLATDLESSSQLEPSVADLGRVGCTTLAFEASKAPYPEPMLVVSGNDQGPVNHLAVISNVCPEAAPHGKALVSATVLGIPEESDEELAGKVKAQLERWFPGKSVETWRLLNVNRIPFAQYRQDPGFADKIPEPQGNGDGLFFTGEQTTYSSIDGACLSGAQTAAAVSKYLEEV